MTILIQIFGLIINLYLVFLFTSRNSMSFNTNFKVDTNKIKNKNYWLSNVHFDQNRLELLNRITILLLLSYKIFELDFYQTGFFELSLLDGILKISNTKSLINLSIFIITIKLLQLQLNYNYNNKTKITGEIYLIFLTNILGITLLLSSNDWIFTIISWELFNFSLYLLVSLNSYSESSLSAAQKYFLLSAFSTGFLLLGLSIIYYLTGSTHYDAILTSTKILSGDLLLIFAIILILFTFLFKLSAAPFYHWAPDLYDGLNTNISIWMMIIPKITVFSLIYLLMDFLIIPGYTDIFLLISGILSLIIGSGALAQQWNIKRFFCFQQYFSYWFYFISFIL